MEQHQQPFCPPGRGCSSALGRTRHCLKGSDESFWCKHPARPFLQHRSSVFRPRPASWLLHLGTGTATGVTPAGNWARDGGTGGMLGLHPGVLLDEASWCARGNCGKFPPSCIYGTVVWPCGFWPPPWCTLTKISFGVTLCPSLLSSTSTQPQPRLQQPLTLCVSPGQTQPCIVLVSSGGCTLNTN